MFRLPDTTSSRRVRRRYRIRRYVGACIVGVVFAVSGGATALAFGDGGQPSVGDTGEDTLLASRSEQGQSESTTEATTEKTTEEIAVEEPINVLVLGVDKRPEGEETEAMGVRADTIMVARLSPDTGKTSLLSIPRDLFLEISPGEEDRINASYALGGVDQTKAVVENYTDIPIDHYAIIDFAGFEDFVDAVGGVEVQIEDGDYPPGWRLDACEKQTLDGRQALLYARYRGSAGGDLDRIRRQQGVVNALKSKAFGLDALVRFPSMTKAVFENTDTDVGLAESWPLIKAAFYEVRKSSGGIHSYSLKGAPTYLDDGRQVLTPEDEENRQILSEFTDPQTEAAAGGESAEGEQQSKSGAEQETDSCDVG